MIELTVFTPAYNRAHTLPRTYKSLKDQKCKDFIWLIIDDGSTDSTFQLVKNWQLHEKDFEIQYIYKENGGMHTAHNTAYDNIHTELNICIDSDDCLAPDAVQLILTTWSKVKNKGYAGLIGLDADFQGNIIGCGFQEHLTETTLSGYYSHGGKGDKKLIYRTDVIKKYPPYPVFTDEKYVALAYKYLLIDQDYKLAVVPHILCNVEYQPDGSSCSMMRQYIKNPQGFAFWRTIQAQYPTSIIQLLKNCIHYSSSKIIAHKQGKTVLPFPYPVLQILCMPLGYILTKYILKKNNLNE